jgi:uncharacterized protein YfaS (alpha-2-macroglobulin family)
MKLIPRFFAFSFIAFSFLLFTEEVNAKKQNVNVVTITPQGNVESAEQVQVRFSNNMIKLGDEYQSHAPVKSNCLDSGNGYWTDQKNWVYTFYTIPAPGKTCTIKTINDLKDLNGKMIPFVSVDFKTTASQILKIVPGTYQSIDPDQFFVVILNGEVTNDWVKKNVYVTIEGLGDKVPVNLIYGKQKDEIIASAKTAEPYNFTDDDSNQQKKYYYVLKAQRTFPRGSNVILQWIKELHFNVIKDFKADFSCERESADQGCVPLTGMMLSFNQDISVNLNKSIYLQKKNGEKIYDKSLSKKNSNLKISNLNFEGPFEENTEYVLNIGTIQSESGEKLSNQSAFPLKVRTGNFPSLLKIERPFSIIESSHPILPVTVRNVENPLTSHSMGKPISISGSKAVLNGTQIAKIINSLSSFYSTPLEDPFPMAAKRPFEYKYKKSFPNDKTETLGVNLETKGFHFVEFKSRILGDKINYQASDRGKELSGAQKAKSDFYVRAAALVTNISLTMKYSPSEVLVWATSLDKGQPLSNLNIDLYSQNAKLIKQLKTDKDGIALFSLTETEYNKLTAQNPKSYSRTFYAFATDIVANDFSFVASSDTEGLEKYRFGLSLPYQNPKNIYHAIFEKSLLRPKETLKVKLVYRKLENTGLSIPTIKLPKEIQITNQLTDKKFLTPVKWDQKSGTGIIEWKIPDEATLGQYLVTFPTRDNDAEKNNDSEGISEFEAESVSGFNRRVAGLVIFGEFNVQEFKTPSITSKMQALNIPWINVVNHKIDFSAQYFSGGPASQLPIKVKYSVAADSFTVNNEDYEGFRWLVGDVKEGVMKIDRENNENTQPNAQLLDLKLDKYGQVTFDLKKLNYKNTPQRAVVSVEYQDANGDIQNVTRAYPLLISKYAVGIRAHSWFLTGEAFDFDAAVLDLTKKSIPNKEIIFTLYQQENYSSRKKLIGGFYSYESFQETKKIKDICRVKTGLDGKASCHYSDKSLDGHYIVKAQIKDDNGATISSSDEAYVYKNESWYGGGNSDRIDLIPSKKSYEPGEYAEFQVRGPITEGQLLLTVERDHILHREIQNFKISNPTVRIKIKEEWAPNVVVSAALVRGRIEGKVTGLLDLGKPNFKMGLASIRIGINKHKLSVKVKTNKEIYEPRENVSSEINVTDSQGKPVNGEIAIAAVDEALLALSPNYSWNLLESMIPLRAHQFDTAYALSQVLGRRTLGLKAVPLGGDGAGSSTRELFDTSLFWNPRVLVKNGQAQVNFKTNDAMTSFKIVAIALSGAEQFGSGDSIIRVNKEIQTFPSMAQAVRKGDQFLARFNIRNSTAKLKQLTVNLNFNGNNLATKSIQLPAGTTQEVSWSVTSPEAAANADENKYLLKVTDPTGTVVDSILIKQPNHNVWPMRTMAASMQQGSEIKIPVAKPPNSTKSILSATALPSLAQNLPGLKQYWDLYPFDCFEQRLSKAISLNSKKSFESLMKISEIYMDQSGLIKFYPQSINGSIFLTNYVLQISYHQGWKLDKKFESRALKALEDFFNNVLKTSERLNDAEISLVRLETLDTLSLYKKSSSSMWEALNINTAKFKLELLPNNYLSHAISILALDTGIPQQKELLAQALQVLKSRTVLSPGRLTLKDAVNPGLNLFWLYSSTEQSFAKILIQVLPLNSFHEDGGRLILSFMELMTNGSWNSTLDNAWGAIALRKYKNEFEKESVKGNISWSLAAQKAIAKISEKKSVSKQWDLKGAEQLKAQFTGQGLPWWNILVLADTALVKDYSHGILISKKWTAISAKTPQKKSVGDIWQINLKIESKSVFQWLAVRDPLPPGSTIIDESGAEISEKKALEYRGYESWFRNQIEIVYKIRFNQSGIFQLPSTRAEAMYNPDLYGEKLNAVMVIEP